jgi:hypothetical protein
MDMQVSCPECNALHEDGRSCQDDFYTLLGWETEYEGYGLVHHLAVLCYHLQHPSLYSPQGLEYAKGLLVDFLEKGKTTTDIRHERRDQVSSANRKWKITSRGGSQGAYTKPVGWTMTAADIARDDHTRYIENVHRWSVSILTSLKSSNNL